MEDWPTDTFMDTVESQPNACVSVTDTVPVPGLFHMTVMLLPVDEPTIEPPVTLHATELNVAVCKAYTPVVCVHAVVGPAMAGVGVG